MVSRHWVYFGGFVLTATLTLGAVLLGVFEGLAALSGGLPRSEELVVVTMLAAAAEWVVLALVLGSITVLFLAATVVSVLRTASLPRDDRLVAVVEWLEREYPLLRQFDVSERVEPTTEDRQEQLKQRYVEGELSESEFERRMSELIDETGEGATRSEAETTVGTDDGSR